MNFARHQFELGKQQQDGESLLTHLELVSEKTGIIHPMLANAPPLPGGCLTLWQDFLELHHSRGSTGWGPQRITFMDLDAWQRVNRVRLSAWDIACIRKCDDIWLGEYAPQPKETKH